MFKTDIIKILIVEENDEQYNLIKKLLNLSEYDVFDVSRSTSFKETKEKLENNNFDIMLLDLNLPDTKGLETVFKIKKIFDKPFIVISGISDYSVIIRAIKAGASDYFVKGSYTMDTLTRSIRYTLDKYYLEQELQKYKKFHEHEKQTQFLCEDIHDSMRPLKARRPKKYNEIKKQYSKELDEMFNDHGECSAHNICGKLFRYNASAKDIIDIHTDVLRDKMRQNTPQVIEKYVEMAKIYLTEVFCMCLSLYRNNLLKFLKKN